MSKKNWRSDFCLASEKGELPTIECLFPQINKAKKEQSYFALMFSSFKGHDEIVQFFLDNKVDPNFVVGSYLTPLHAAIFSEMETIVSLLLDNNAVVEPKIKLKQGKKTKEEEFFCSPLLLASLKSNEKMVEMLLQKGADIHAKFQPPKKQSNEANDALENILKYGDLTTKQNEEKFLSDRFDGFTALHFAAENGDEKIAEMLLDSGADINSKCNKDLTPVCIASWKNNVTLVDFLIKRGADVKSLIDNGKHFLHYVLTSSENYFDHANNYYSREKWRNRNKVFNYLLKNGSDPNGWSKSSKENVLHYAARNGMAHAVHLLLKYGADANVADGEAKTPLELAVSRLQEQLLAVEYDIYGRVHSRRHDSNDEELPSRESPLFQQELAARRARDAEGISRFESQQNFRLTVNEYVFSVYYYRSCRRHIQSPVPFKIIAHLLTREHVRLEALGKRNFLQNVKMMETSFVNPYYIRCRNELKKLKKFPIVEGISYHEFLLAGGTKLEEYFEKFQILKRPIDKEFLKETFPNYLRFLKLQHKRRKMQKFYDEGSSDEEVRTGSVRVNEIPKSRRRRYW